MTLCRPFRASMGFVFRVSIWRTFVYDSNLSDPSPFLRRRKLQSQPGYFFGDSPWLTSDICMIRILFYDFYSPSANYLLHYEADRLSHFSSELQTMVAIAYHCHCRQILLFVYFLTAYAAVWMLTLPTVLNSPGCFVSSGKSML